MKRPIYPEDWGAQLEADFDQYMGRLYENVDAEDDDENIVDVTGNYFCGCSDCDRRASWTFLMIRFAEAHRDGILALEEDE